MGPVKCYYQDCANTNATKSMFTFPIKDEHRLKLWIKHSGNASLETLTNKELKNRYICEDHFEPIEVLKHFARSRLTSEAVPHMYKPVTSQTINEKFKCNECSQNIVGLRYVCVQCEDWNLCGQCEALAAHPQHYVLRVPFTHNHSLATEVVDSVRSLVATLLQKQADLEESLSLLEVKKEVEVEDDIYNSEQELSIYQDSSESPLGSETVSEIKLECEVEPEEWYPSLSTKTQEQNTKKRRRNSQTTDQVPIVKTQPVSIKTEHPSTSYLFSVPSTSNSQDNMRDVSLVIIKKKKQLGT